MNNSMKTTVLKKEIECRVHRCSRIISPAASMCVNCWQKVPNDLKRDINLYASCGPRLKESAGTNYTRLVIKAIRVASRPDLRILKG